MSIVITVDPGASDERNAVHDSNWLNYFAFKESQRRFAERDVQPQQLTKLDEFFASDPLLGDIFEACVTRLKRRQAAQKLRM